MEQAVFHCTWTEMYLDIKECAGLRLVGELNKLVDGGLGYEAACLMKDLLACEIEP